MFNFVQFLAIVMLGIRILRGPLRTADLRGPAIFYLFLKIRILRGPHVNSFLFKPQLVISPEQLCGRHTTVAKPGKLASNVRHAF